MLKDRTHNQSPIANVLLYEDNFDLTVVLCYCRKKFVFFSDCSFWV